jgi:hypothetical protein
VIIAIRVAARALGLPGKPGRADVRAQGAAARRAGRGHSTSVASRPVAPAPQRH